VEPHRIRAVIEQRDSRSKGGMDSRSACLKQRAKRADGWRDLPEGAGGLRSIRRPSGSSWRRDFFRNNWLSASRSDFVWGVATAFYQIEGAVRGDGPGTGGRPSESAWTSVGGFVKPSRSEKRVMVPPDGLRQRNDYNLDYNRVQPLKWCSLTT
jgi:Glycosyl hydrolase family 1